jgi:separase
MTLTIISTYLLNSLTIFANISPPPELASLSRTLKETSTLLDWAPHLCALPSMQKHTDAVLTRAYSVLTKSATLVTTSTQMSRELYAVRAYALHLLLHTSQGTIDPNTFWDQAMKFATVLVKGSKTAETAAAKVVLTTFDELAERSQAIDPGRWRQGTSWIDFCDFWMGFAIKVRGAALYTLRKRSHGQRCRLGMSQRWIA